MINNMLDRFYCFYYDFCESSREKVNKAANSTIKGLIAYQLISNRWISMKIYLIDHFSN